MKEFTLDETSLPFNFFNEFELSLESIAIDCIQKIHRELTHQQCVSLYEKNQDVFQDSAYELKDLIDEYAIEEIEIDEASGTWGYVKFRVDDVDEALSRLKEELIGLFEQVSKDL